MPDSATTRPAAEITRVQRRGLGRAIAIAFVIVIASSLIIPYFEHRLSTSALMDSQFPLGILLPFLFLVTVYNVIAKLVSRRLVLRADELITIFVVGLSGVMAQKIMPRLLAVLASPYFHGDAENRWPELVWPLLPSWLLPANEPVPMAWFYNGLRQGVPIPWHAWGPPLVWWLAFVGVVIFVCQSIAVILRRQWVEYERIEFPLARIPLELAQSTAKGQLLPGVFRRRIFWVGFAVPVALITWRILNWFYPGVPIISVGLDAFEIELGRNYEPLYARVDFFIVGFAYFTRLEILLSIWLFHVLGVLQAGMCKGMGFGLEDETAYVGDQAQAGLVFFVLWGLWMARRHLRDVFRKAFTGAADVDDSGEYLSYRTAVFGLILGGAFLWVWMVKMGMTVAAAGILLLASLVIYLGLAKIIAMSGLVYLRPTWNAQVTFRAFVMAGDFGIGSYVGSRLMFATYADNKGYMMPPAMTVQALTGPVRGRSRAVGKAILIAALAAVLIHAVATIRMGYHYGASNFQNYIFTRAGPYPYNAIPQFVDRFREGGGEVVEYRGRRQTFFAIGFGATALLTFLNYRLPWWPLHPVGFTVSWGWPVFYSSLSVFIAWLIKTVILWVGRLQLYRSAQPFFIGLIVGQAFGVLLGLVIDVCWFPGQGHMLFGGDV